MNVADLIDRAERFVLTHGRLLERRLFAFKFRGQPADDVVAALLPYRNSDGGFGSGLEPDIQDPHSQSVPTQFALTLLDQIDRFEPSIVGPACDFLQTVSTPEGGVPWLLPSALAYPRSPWWQTEEPAPASLNPTAEIVGLLHKHQVDHPWLQPAASYCWSQLQTFEPTDMFDVGCVLTFLTHTADQERAQPILDKLIRGMFANHLVAALDAEGYVHKPLDWAPQPEGPFSTYFSADLITANLDQIVAEQQADGGWPLPFPPLSPTVAGAWRSWITIEKLHTLQAYTGRKETNL